MNFQKLTGTLKRLESLVALALAKAKNGQKAIDVLKNNTSANNIAPIGPTLAPELDTGLLTIVADTDGKVVVTADMTVTGAGGTSVAGELVQFGLTMGGAPLPELGQAELSATHNVASCALTGRVTGLLPGSAHTFGIVAANVTSPLNTLVVPIGMASVVAGEVL